MQGLKHLQEQRNFLKQDRESLNEVQSSGDIKEHVDQSALFENYPSCDDKTSKGET